MQSSFVKRQLSRLRILPSYLRVMATPADLIRFAHLKSTVGKATKPTTSTAIRIRSLGGRTVFCRPLQSDVFTLGSTFIDMFHLPPVQLRKHANIVDLGSNVGYTVAHFAVLYPDARVIGVEMDEANYHLAKRNTADFGDRVQLINAAVWRTNGSVQYAGVEADQFAVNDNPTQSSARTAPSIRVDTLFDSVGMETVDYVKMDVEGAEKVIFEDMAWAKRVKAMKIEIHPPATLEECRRKLEASGFRCWQDDKHWNALSAVRGEAKAQ
jgi:FkbM family methyltransferase